jgi:hypothetical protein
VHVAGALEADVRVADRLGPGAHERAAVGPELDEPIGRRPLEGLADRAATHPELSGDLDLVQPRAGRHLAVQDAVAQGALDAIAERVAAHCCCPACTTR